MRHTTVYYCFLFLFISCNQNEKADSSNDYLSKARQLVRQGKYEEALKSYIWYHDHILEIDPAERGVRLSFALSYWQDLGEKYPPALDSLKSKRDFKTQHILETGGPKQYFIDVASINGKLGERKATVELFTIVSEKYPDYSKEMFRYAMFDLLEFRSYAIAQQYMGNPLDHYMVLENFYIKPLPEFGDETRLIDYNKDRFVIKALELLKYCLAIGDIKNAIAIQVKALAIVDDDRLKVPINS